MFINQSLRRNGACFLLTLFFSSNFFKQPPHPAWSPMQGLNSQPWAEIKSQIFNRLSHEGVPQFFLIEVDIQCHTVAGVQQGLVSVVAMCHHTTLLQCTTVFFNINCTVYKASGPKDSRLYLCWKIKKWKKKSINDFKNWPKECYLARDFKILIFHFSSGNVGAGQPPCSRFEYFLVLDKFE